MAEDSICKFLKENDITVYYGGLLLLKKLTQKQKLLREYMKFHSRETGMNRHTVAKHYELIREMAEYR